MADTEVPMNSSTGHDTVTEQALIAAVERLATLEGLNPRAGTLWQSLRRVSPEQPSTQQLVRLAETAGLSVRAAPAKVPIETLLRNGAAIVRPMPNGAWRVVRQRRGLARREVECWDFPSAPVGRILPVDQLDPGDLPDPWFTADPSTPGGAMLIPPEHPQGAAPVQRVWRLARLEQSDIGAVFIYSLARGLLTLAIPLTVQILINTVAFGALRQPLVLLSVLLLLCLGLAAFLGALQRVVIENIQQRVFAQLVADLAWRLPRVKRAVFDTRHGPEVLNRFFDVITVQKASASLLLQATDSALQAGVGLLLLAFYHPWLAAFDLVLLIGLAVVWGLLGQTAAATSIRESYAKYAVAAWLQDVAGHSTLFKTQGGPALAVERADALTSEYLSARRMHFSAYMQQFVGTLALQGIAGAGLLGLGGMLVLKGELSLGQLVAAEIVVTTVLAALVKFADKLETWYDLLAGVDKLGNLVELPTERIDGLELRTPTGGVSVELHDLKFGYRNPLFENVNLRIPALGRVVIEGPTASGKSSLADLLLGLREPSSGLVRLDGDDLRDLRLGAIREQALLIRGAEVFMGTIADNVAWEEQRVDRRVIKDALQRVGLLDAILAMPEGLDTLLTPEGRPLSDGQLRRLQIARALVARPRLLIVDHLVEGLSAAERRTVLEPLLDPTQPWTLVLFSREPVDLPSTHCFRLESGTLKPSHPGELRRG